MRQDFVDKLELELRAAGERQARGGLAFGTLRVARRQLLAPAIAAVGVVMIAVVLAATALRSDETTPAQPGPKLVADTHLVSAGGSLASGFGAVWVADTASGRVLRLDPRTRAVEARISLGGEAWVDTAAGSVWALGRDRLLRIDPSSNRVVASIGALRAAPGEILEGGGAVWIAYPDALIRIDPRRNVVTRTLPTSRAGYYNVGAVSDGRILYLARRDGRLLRIDARTGKVLSAVRAPELAQGRPIDAVGTLLGVADGTVFMIGKTGVLAVDAATGRARWSRDLRADGVSNGALAGATLWVNATDGATHRDRLWRLDARTGHVTGSLGLPEFGASGMAAVGKQVWTMSTGGDLQVAR